MTYGDVQNQFICLCVVSIGFYFVPLGFHQWGLILFEIITIFFEKNTPSSKKSWYFIDKKQLKWQVCFPPTGMQGWKIYEERMLHERVHYSITM